MTSLIFIAFHSLLFLIGRGFIIIFAKFLKADLNFDKHKIANLELLNFYPVLALFIIGNLTVFLNFFVPVKNIFIFFLLIIFSNFLSPLKKFDKKSTIYFIVNPFLLGISSYGISIAQDAGLYHLNAQSWIINEKVNFGLTNLHLRYGYSSIFEYISSNFWIIENNFILIHFLNLTFIVLFYNFIFCNLFESNNTHLKSFSIALLIFGFLDNFGINGGRNGYIDIEAITKYDTSFAIVYLLAFIILVNSIVENNFSKVEISVIVFLVVFSVQLRIFGASLFPIFLFWILKILRGNNIKKLKASFSIGSLLLSLFFLKNFFISGCLVFPISSTCFKSLPWFKRSSAYLESTDLNNFHISYNFGENFMEWFSRWSSKEFNYSTLLNFAFSFLIVYLFHLFFFKSLEKNNLLKLIIFFQIFISFIIWIISAPGIRFGLGLFIQSLVLISISYLNYDNRLKISNKAVNTIYSSLFIVTIIFTLRINSYSDFFINYTNFVSIEPKLVTYIDNPNGWGVLTANNTSSCWINIECLPEKSKVKRVKGFYDYFISE